MLKVLHLSTYELTGGAARASYRLHQAMNATSGVESRLLVERAFQYDLATSGSVDSLSLRFRASRFFHRRRIQRRSDVYVSSRPEGYDMFSDVIGRSDDSFNDHLAWADVVNLHWVAGFLDYEAFFLNLPDRLPIVWTLHDMNPVTGGCHYSGACERYTKCCGKCPQLGSIAVNDLSRKIWESKDRCYESLSPERTRLVSPSTWLSTCVSKSSLMPNIHVEVIPNGVDTELFSPQVTKTIREKFGISECDRVLGFVADSISNKRKGFQILLDAISGLSDTNLVIVTVGKDAPKLDTNLRHAHVGAVDDDNFLAELFSMFDVFCCPSLEDNLPNTVLEAMACGTPVVGFAIGGMVDMVEHGKNGFLSESISAESLGNCFRELLFEGSDIVGMSISARNRAVHMFEISLQVQRYRELYHRLVNSEVC